jgi:osmoprotectant transport system permease protein
MNPLYESCRSFLKLAIAERADLAASTAAHLDLVLEAIVLAVAIGVPLGIVATRSKSMERVVVGLANVLQTVPSLALLGFLLILFRGTIGKPPALAALVIYALLPIIKNTVLGLRSVDRGVSEAAVGMGMTAWQRLLIVELPLAVPIILGGVRVATVATRTPPRMIGTASGNSTSVRRCQAVIPMPSAASATPRSTPRRPRMVFLMIGKRA